MKNIIFHIPQKLDLNRASASQIRPKKILEAFVLSGYQVDVVEGEGNTRKKQIAKIKNKIKNGIKYDFLYSESSTMPTLLTESHHFPTYPCLDFSFFAFCKKNNIPIGLFYRDIYWCFEQNCKTFKSTISKFFYQYDLKQYQKYVDTLFVPSLEMLDYLPYSLQMNKYSLPSGCELINHQTSEMREKIEILYVGGVGSHYNLKMMVKVVSENQNFKLSICTRKEEWEAMKDEYKMYLADNVTVVFAKNDELKDLYARADLFCLYFKPDEYRKFAVPFKLFESIGHGIPFIASANTFCGNYIDKHKIGFVAAYSEDEIHNLLQKIAENRDEITKYKKNTVLLGQNNTWQYRVKEIAQCLCSTSLNE